MKRYIFVLMKGGQPLSMYIGDEQLPPEIVNHELSLGQMQRALINDYNYKKIR